MRCFRNERGSAVVIVAAGLVALVGFAALTIDVGLLFLNRGRLTNAVDAAALSGAQFLPENPTGAENAAREFAIKNGVRSDEVNVAVIAAEKMVKVTAQRSVQLYLAPVVGFKHALVSAQAQARVGGATEVFGVVPIGVPDQVLDYGRLYTLKVASGDPVDGNFGALALQRPGASDYETNFKYGFDGWFAIGDIINTEPGNISGPTVRAVAYRVGGHESCTHLNYCKDCPRVVLVPVYKHDVLHGRSEVQICGFATFFLAGTTAQGNDCWVHGYFLKKFNGIARGLNGPDYGTRTAKLVQ
jgi:hypothetical protein